jgi:serine/threonine-protein kinase ATR
MEDTLRTHIRGVLSRYPEWLSDLAAFQVEAAWMVGDWTAVQQVIESDVPQSAEVSLGKVLLAMRQKNAQLPAILTSARRELGAAVTASGQLYPRAYDSVLSLHQLHEIEMIRELENLPNAGSNKAALMASRIQSLTSALNSRFQATLPSYKVRESLLSMRRTAYGLSAQAALRAETGLAWISSAKIARKTGHEQTAYSATLQARELDAPFAFVQQAKLLHTHDGAFKALVSLEHGLRPLLKTANSGIVDLTKDDGPLPGHDRHLAKVSLVTAYVAHSRRFYSKHAGRTKLNDSPLTRLLHGFIPRLSLPLST